MVCRFQEKGKLIKITLYDAYLKKSSKRIRKGDSQSNIHDSSNISRVCGICFFFNFAVNPYYLFRHLYIVFHSYQQHGQYMKVCTGSLTYPINLGLYIQTSRIEYNIMSTNIYITFPFGMRTIRVQGSKHN